MRDNYRLNIVPIAKLIIFRKPKNKISGEIKHYIAQKNVEFERDLI